MNIKKVAMLALPAFLLVGCSKGEEIHVSTPKEILYKEYDDGETYLYKHTFEYDENGEKKVENWFDFNEDTKSYVQERRYEWETDKNGNVVLFLEYLTDATGDILVYKVASIYEGDRLVKEESYSLNDQNELYLEYYEGDYVYDSLDRVLSAKTYTFDLSTNQFVVTADYSYEYFGEFKEFIKCVNNEYGSYPMTMVLERELDNNGNIVTDIGITDGFGQMECYSYTEAGEVASCVTYFFDTDEKIYNIVSMYNYTYLNDHYLKDIQEIYFTDGNIDKIKYEHYSYDEELNILGRREYKVDLETNESIVLEEDIYIY